MPDVKERTRPLRADAQRSIASVIDAARAVLAEDPHADMQAIALAAGVNRATVYRHFASRDELLRTVYLEYAERFTQIVETLDCEAPDAAAELRRVTLELLAHADHWRPFRYAAPFPQDIDEHRVRMAERLIPLLERGQREGAFRADFEPLELAIAWGTPFPYASIRLSEDSWSREHAADFILRLITPCD